MMGTSLVTESSVETLDPRSRTKVEMGVDRLPLPTLLADDFEVGGELGRGTFAKIFRIRERGTGAEFAVKVMERNFFSVRGIDHFIANEIAAMKQCVDAGLCQRVVRLVDALEEHGRVYLQMEVCGCSLLEYAHFLPNRRAPEAIAAMWAEQLFEGLRDLHGLGIVHRDIKADNLLLSLACDTIKIADFGWCAVIADEPTGLAGTFDTMAPEVLGEQLPHTGAVDVWGAGCTVFRLLTGADLFERSLDAGPTGLSESDPTGAGSAKAARILIEISEVCPLQAERKPDFLSDLCWDLLRLVIEPSCTARMTVREALRHLWVRCGPPSQLATPTSCPPRESLVSTTASVAAPGVTPSSSRARLESLECIEALNPERLLCEPLSLNDLIATPTHGPLTPGSTTTTSPTAARNVALRSFHVRLEEPEPVEASPNRALFLTAGRDEVPSPKFAPSTWRAWTGVTSEACNTVEATSDLPRPVLRPRLESRGAELCFSPTRFRHEEPIFSPLSSGIACAAPESPCPSAWANWGTVHADKAGTIATPTGRSPRIGARECATASPMFRSRTVSPCEVRRPRCDDASACVLPCDLSSAGWNSQRVSMVGAVNANAHAAGGLLKVSPRRSCLSSQQPQPQWQWQQQQQQQTPTQSMPLQRNRHRSPEMFLPGGVPERSSRSPTGGAGRGSVPLVTAQEITSSPQSFNVTRAPASVVAGSGQPGHHWMGIRTAAPQNSVACGARAAPSQHAAIDLWAQVRS